VKARARLLPANPRRAKPKGAASGRRTNPVSAARDSRKGQSPETAARWAGPPLRGGGITDGLNGTWVLPRRKAADTFREEKAPQGESHERRRREKKPARARRA